MEGENEINHDMYIVERLRRGLLGKIPQGDGRRQKAQNTQRKNKERGRELFDGGLNTPYI